MWSSILAIVITINELMASNAGVVMSPATNFDSWIELYNPSEQEVNLAGMYLSNDAGNLTRWQMPDDIGKVPAKGFKVVWLGSNDIMSNQAPFKLDCDGGTICLSDKNGQLITSVDYPKAMSRTAWARTSDGGNTWGWTDAPTPGAMGMDRRTHPWGYKCHVDLCQRTTGTTSRQSRQHALLWFIEYQGGYSRRNQAVIHHRWQHATEVHLMLGGRGKSH